MLPSLKPTRKRDRMKTAIIFATLIATTLAHPQYGYGGYRNDNDDYNGNGWMPYYGGYGIMPYYGGYGMMPFEMYGHGYGGFGYGRKWRRWD